MSDEEAVKSVEESGEPVEEEPPAEPATTADSAADDAPADDAAAAETGTLSEAPTEQPTKHLSIEQPVPSTERVSIAAPKEDITQKTADRISFFQKSKSKEQMNSLKYESELKKKISVKMSTDTLQDSRIRASSIASLGQKRSSIRTDDKRFSERLSSKAKIALGSVLSIRKQSMSGDVVDKTKGARYMNTYKLDSDNPFNPEKVQKILESVMTEALENLTYDTDKCPKQAKWASSAIRAKVKELEFERYKIICLVTIGEKNSQDVLVTCRFLWDTERDRFATFSMENTHVFGVAQCLGLYYE